MINLDRTTATRPAPIDSLRKTALVAGVIYLITFVSIPTLSLYGPVRNDPNDVLGPGPDTPILIGAILEVIVALACVGTGLVPGGQAAARGDRNGLRRLAGPGCRHHLAGVVSLLSVVTLRQAGAGAGALATSQALVAFNSWTFLLGESFLPVVNGCCWDPCNIAPAWWLGPFRSWC